MLSEHTDIFAGPLTDPGHIDVGDKLVVRFYVSIMKNQFKGLGLFSVDCGTFFSI